MLILALISFFPAIIAPVLAQSSSQQASTTIFTISTHVYEPPLNSSSASSDPVPPADLCLAPPNLTIAKNYSTTCQDEFLFSNATYHRSVKVRDAGLARPGLLPPGGAEPSCVSGFVLDVYQLPGCGGGIVQSTYWSPGTQGVCGEPGEPHADGFSVANMNISRVGNFAQGFRVAQKCAQSGLVDAYAWLRDAAGGVLPHVQIELATAVFVNSKDCGGTWTTTGGTGVAAQMGAVETAKVVYSNVECRRVAGSSIGAGSEAAGAGTSSTSMSNNSSETSTTSSSTITSAGTTTPIYARIRNSTEVNCYDGFTVEFFRQPDCSGGGSGGGNGSGSGEPIFSKSFSAKDWLCQAHSSPSVSSSVSSSAQTSCKLVNGPAGASSVSAFLAASSSQTANLQQAGTSSQTVLEDAKETVDSNADKLDQVLILTIALACLIFFGMVALFVIGDRVMLIRREMKRIADGAKVETKTGGVSLVPGQETPAAPTDLPAASSSSSSSDEDEDDIPNRAKPDRDAGNSTTTTERNLPNTSDWTSEDVKSVTEAYEKELKSQRTSRDKAQAEATRLRWEKLFIDGGGGNFGPLLSIDGGAGGRRPC